MICRAALSWTSDLLGLNCDQLAEVLTHRSMILRGEEISTPLTVEQVRLYGVDSCVLSVLMEGGGRFVSGHLRTSHRCLLRPLQAVDSRDSMAMALYSQCFNWIIHKLNMRIRGKEDFRSISILDIFGFENFEVCAQRNKSLQHGHTAGFHGASVHNSGV